MREEGGRRQHRHYVRGDGGEGRPVTSVSAIVVAAADASRMCLEDTGGVLYSTAYSRVVLVQLDFAIYMWRMTICRNLMFFGLNFFELAILPGLWFQDLSIELPPIHCAPFPREIDWN